MQMKNALLSLSVVALLVANPAFAAPPIDKGSGKQEHAERGNGKGKGKNHAVDERPDDRERQNESGREHEASSRGGSRGSAHFDERQRSIVRDYYRSEYHSGHCPPGLAKKNNGCMPPGQAKKWRVGQPLPREVIFYDVPPALVVRIGIPPAGYRYVRVAADILLIAAGTAMVVDAITDLGDL